MFNLLQDRIMLCKTDATLNNISEKLFKWREVLRDCQKAMKSANINLLRGTVMHLM